MSRLSLLILLKTIPICVVVGFCLHQIHMLLQPQNVFMKKAGPLLHMSEQETRAFDLLRLQFKKNQLQREEHEQQEQMLRQKLADLQKVVVEQKKQLQTQLQQKKSEVSPKTVQQPLQQQQKQQLKQGPQPVGLKQVEVQGQKSSLHPSVNVVPSVPPKNSTLNPRICLPLPQSPRPVTVCIYDPKTDTFISGAVQAGRLWEDIFVLHMATVLKSNPDMGLVDIGANIGIYTLTAAASGRNVIAIDMLDTNILLLQHSLQLSNLSSKVTLVKNAVYKDNNSKISCKTYENNMARVFIVEDAQKPGTIQSVCLDNLIPLVKSKAVFMKMDVANSEHHALACGHDFFTQINVKVVQMKWSQKSQEATEQIRNFMRHYNYTANILVGTSYHLWEMNSSNWTGEVFFLK